MKPRSAIKAATLILALALVVAGCSRASPDGDSGPVIKFQLISVVRDDHGTCSHFYSIQDIDGNEVVPVTPLPDNETIAVTLPKTKGDYALRLYNQRGTSGGSESVNDMDLDQIFNGNKNQKFRFTASRLGHGIEPAKFSVVSYILRKFL